MAGTASSALEHVAGLLPHHVRRAEQNRRIEVPLHGDGPQRFPRLVEGHPPVQPDHVCATLLDNLVESAGPGCEVYDRNT